MKKLLLTILPFCLFGYLNAQNNTFPNTGNVGIGTTSPSAKLDVRTTDNKGIRLNANDESAITFVPNNGNSIFHLSHGHDNKLYFSQGGIVGGGKLMTITNVGKVGIGTTSPSAKLDVRTADNKGIRLNANDESAITFVPNNGNSIFHLSHGHDNKLHFSQGGTVGGGKLMTITNIGKVGIGTANPSAKLQVETSNTDHAMYVKNQGTTSSFWPLYIDSKYTRSSGFISKPTGIELQLRDAAGQAHIGIRDNGVSFFNGGTVAIGFTSPNTNYDLQVQGNSDFKQAISFNNNKEGRITWGSGAGGQGSFFGLIAQTNRALSLGANGQFDHFVIRPDGKIGIGSTNPDAKLTVNGTIHTEEVLIDLSVPGPDYVFESDYNLLTLNQIKSYIEANKHLPEVPSAKEMETNGVELGDMSMILLKKIEELTLYTLDQEKKINNQKAILLEKEKELEQQVGRLNNQDALIQSLIKRIEKIESSK